MMTLGVIKRLDAQGRLQVPLEIRNLLKLDGEDLNIYVEGNKVIISKPFADKTCVICGKQTGDYYKDLCDSCLGRYKVL